MKRMQKEMPPTALKTSNPEVYEPEFLTVNRVTALPKFRGCETGAAE
jgi:hypothetical protein